MSDQNDRPRYEVIVQGLAVTLPPTSFDVKVNEQSYRLRYTHYFDIEAFLRHNHFRAAQGAIREVNAQNSVKDRENPSYHDEIPLPTKENDHIADEVRAYLKRWCRPPNMAVLGVYGADDALIGIGVSERSPVDNWSRAAGRANAFDSFVEGMEDHDRRSWAKAVCAVDKGLQRAYAELMRKRQMRIAAVEASLSMPLQISVGHLVGLLERTNSRRNELPTPAVEVPVLETGAISDK